VTDARAGSDEQATSPTTIEAKLYGDSPRSASFSKTECSPDCTKKSMRIFWQRPEKSVMSIKLSRFMFLRPWVAVLKRVCANSTAGDERSQFCIMPRLLHDYLLAIYFGCATVASLAVFMLAPFSMHFALIVLIELLTAIVCAILAWR
jgi:hypothetical protein